MDEKTVRTHLQEVRDSLQRIDDEREVLVPLIQAYEGWLSRYGTQNDSEERKGQLSLPVDSKNGDKKVSWRGAITSILKEAHGAPLHTKEIWERAKVMGLRTEAKSPLGLLDLNIRAIRGIEKTGPRLWRWVGDEKTVTERQWKQVESGTYRSIQ